MAFYVLGSPYDISPYAFSHPALECPDCMMAEEDTRAAQGEAGPSPTSRLCKYFSSGGCYKGDSCEFVHDASAVWPSSTPPPPPAVPVPIALPLGDDEFSPPLPSLAKPCFFWYHTGRCLRGARCRYNHGEPTPDSFGFYSSVTRRHPCFSSDELCDETQPASPTATEGQQFREADVAEPEHDEQEDAGSSSADGDSKEPTTPEAQLEGYPRQRFSTWAPKELKFRTKGCAFFFHTGHCQKGDRCNFSHEMKPGMELPPLPEGARRPGVLADLGEYIAESTEEEDAEAEEQPHKYSMYRTKPCRFFFQRGSCLKGDHCNFSHDPSMAASIENSGSEGSS